MGRPKKNISFSVYPKDMPSFDKHSTVPLGSRIALLRKLSHTRVDIGLLDSASERSKGILRIQEAGSPVMNIPPRPVLKPALNGSLAKWTMEKHMELAVQCADKGDEKGMEENLNAVGRTGVEAIHVYIDAGIPPPNAPITKQGGWMRNPVSGKPVKIEGKGDKPPLVDTGQLRSEFSYEIKGR